LLYDAIHWGDLRTREDRRKNCTGEGVPLSAVANPGVVGDENASGDNCVCDDDDEDDDGEDDDDEDDDDEFGADDDNGDDEDIQSLAISITSFCCLVFGLATGLWTCSTLFHASYNKLKGSDLLEVSSSLAATLLALFPSTRVRS
ncbi:probable DNA-directed RNA polymerase subunit delta, partial [Anopheles stephensi]|uniref:probable DNA-directed RNA polymerase subunit delta n=1 Tax=Anopheles stephensi TaxID=30069 RepID=UPI001658B875